jgi:hypothetical protein
MKEQEDDNYIESMEYLCESMINGQRKQCINLVKKYGHNFDYLREYVESNCITSISIDDIHSLEIAVIQDEN